MSKKEEKKKKDEKNVPLCDTCKKSFLYCKCEHNELVK